jgi:hypothetical protein
MAVCVKTARLSIDISIFFHMNTVVLVESLSQDFYTFGDENPLVKQRI